MRPRWPAFVADERAMLENWLDWHRQTLAIKCDRLTDEQLRERPVPPSTMSLLGLVRHMAEVERAWFQRRIAHRDAPLLYCSEGDEDGDFDNVDTADIAEAFATWDEQCAISREILAGIESLDETFVREGTTISVRWLLMHMVEEYARHNGHADLFREKLDGTTGL